MSEIFDKNKLEKIVKDLENLGLSDKESRVYISLLKAGEVGSSKILKDTGLHGQFVYSALETLSNKGLIQYVTRKGRKKFSAKNPYILSVLVDNKKLIADRLANELQTLIALPQGQTFEAFQGIDAYKAQEFNLIEQASSKSDILIIGGIGDQLIRILGRDFNKYDSIRNKKQIAIRYIGNNEQKHELNVFSQARERFDYKVLPGSFSGLVNTAIYDTKLIFTMFGDPIVSTTLINSLIAQSYRQFFETLWNLGTK